MKKANVTILASICIMALVALVGSVGTMAWFSTSTETTDTFTMNSATMSMGITTGSYTFDNLVPGEAFGPVHIKIVNTGTMNIKYLAGDLILGAVGPTALEFADKIEVTSILEYIPGSPAGWYESMISPQNYWSQVQDYAMPLTLLELAQSYYGVEPGTGAKVDQFGGNVKSTSDWITGGTYDQVPTDAIPVGGTYQMKLYFKFSEDAGNDLQTKTLSFTIRFLGMQDYLSQTP